MTAWMAERISANPGAVRLLEALHQRQLFVDRKAGTDVTYHFHALFKAFLLSRAREIFTPTGLIQLSRRAAGLLEESNMFEDAVNLYLEASDWVNARRLIEAYEEEMFTSARWTTLLGWIAVLPESDLITDAWLIYWRGMANVAHHPIEAADLLERAFQGFARGNNQVGQVLACTGAMRAFHSNVHGEYPRINEWMQRMIALLQDSAIELDSVQSLDAYAGLTYALHWHDTVNPFRQICHVKLLEPCLSGCHTRPPDIVARDFAA